jgi:hypothetical protein
VEAALAGIGQRRSDQGVSDAMAAAGRRHLRMLEVEDVLAEGRVNELGFPIGEEYHESGVLRIMLDGHAGRSQEISERQRIVGPSFLRERLTIS